MADEPGAEAASPRKSFPKKTIGVVMGIAVVQGALFFAAFKFLGGGPEPAHGEDSHAIEGEATKKPTGVAEVALLRGFKVPNEKRGRLWIYDIDVSVVVPEDRKGDMQEIAKKREAEIADRVARILRAATDDVLTEVDLRILRGQIKEMLDELTEDPDLVQRILLPRFVPISG